MKIRSFSPAGVAFARYPFAPATVYPQGIVPWEEIAEINLQAWPPELRLHSGEILFVSADERDRLRSASERFEIDVVQRVDVWHLLLEPFLDTEFDEKHQEQTLCTLEANDVAREETAAIRREVGPKMLRYNTYVWEWVHLGLFDLLATRFGSYLPNWLPVLGRRERRYYWWAMEVARRGKVLLPEEEKTAPLPTRGEGRRRRSDDASKSPAL